jgi:hypothetical protein
VSAGTVVRNYVATNVARNQAYQPLLSSKNRLHCQTHKRFWNEHKLGHRSRRVSKPRTTVLARASSSLLDWTVAPVEGESPSSSHIPSPVEEEDPFQNIQYNTVLFQPAFATQLMVTVQTTPFFSVQEYTPPQPLIQSVSCYSELHISLSFNLT